MIDMDELFRSGGWSEMKQEFIKSYFRHKYRLSPHGEKKMARSYRIILMRLKGAPFKEIAKMTGKSKSHAGRIIYIHHLNIWKFNQRLQDRL